MKYETRSQITGRFISRSHARRIATLRRQQRTRPETVVTGRLYGWKGAVVRAGRKVNQLRLVTLHKSLVGYVPDNELSLVTPETVKGYLKTA
jgi:hypothetical protein